MLACVGVGNALVDIGLFTLMARLASDEVLARVFGLLESLIALSVGLGALFASFLIDLFSARTAPVMVGFYVRSWWWRRGAACEAWTATSAVHS
jgi:hypothetical protein